MAKSTFGFFLLLLVTTSSYGESPEAPNESAADQGRAPTANPGQIELDEIGHPTFVSPHASPIAISGNLVFVANTPADTVDVIQTNDRRVITRISVGIDPVSLAVRPDGREVWVANHVSDTVSVIDNDPENATYLQIVATIQDIDPSTKATRFDEPVGIAFANNEKAYVALSSENQIAVINVATREVTKTLTITAQDPRAIVVRNERLYVLPFESNNQTQLSGGNGQLDGDLITFNAHQHSVANNNVLSLGAVVDIIKHPRVPDRDLYVFDTKNDRLVEVVDSIGTLLYGLAVDSKGQVFVAQTDARNDINGRSGTKSHGLKELGNRAFLNQITRIHFDEDDEAETPRRLELEPLPPIDPDPGMALATPFAVEISRDDTTLYATAAGSDKLFTMDAASGEVIGRIDVGAVPRGIALSHEPDGTFPTQAWVLNAVDNSVSVVNVTDASSMQLVDLVTLDDPTHPAVKRGRIAFNTARASSSGTFSCASCHPDGHTDQLLWVLKTPIVTGGDQIMPRSTMPIRGLRDTAPYHWDGIPGDPYGGNNSANVHGADEPNSREDEPNSSTRHLIDGGLASTMLRVGDAAINDEGKSGLLSAAERDDMATFLLSVPYPPAQRRSYSNVVSSEAQKGFRLFHIEGDHQGDPSPNVCGDCHRMPFLVSTNTPGTGMDAPTWRGAYDRFLILPQGRLNIIDFDFYRRVAERGTPERNVWQFSWAGRRRFDPVWNMVLENSTGFSGSFARQVTLNEDSAKDKTTADLLDSLELSATEGAIILEADGCLFNAEEQAPSHRNRRLQLRFVQGSYVNVDNSQAALYQRDQLVKLAASGKFVGTFTGRHGSKDDVEHPQPAIWTIGPIEQQRGHQEFPVLYPSNRTIKVSGRHLEPDAHVVVDGRRVDGTVRLGESEVVEIALAELPTEGMHLVQLQNPHGQFSNDFIFHVVADEAGHRALARRIERAHGNPGEALGRAVIARDAEAVRRLLEEDDVDINAHRSDGSTALSTAALFGHTSMARLLLDNGAKVNARNRDGNTPLHVAGFLGRMEIVDTLIDAGASVTQENERGETPIESVSGAWNEGLAAFYRGIASGIGQRFDLEEIQRRRKVIAKRLRAIELKLDGENGDIEVKSE